MGPSFIFVGRLVVHPIMYMTYQLYIFVKVACLVCLMVFIEDFNLVFYLWDKGYRGVVRACRGSI